MNTVHLPTGKILDLFHDQKVATMPQLKAALGTPVAVTVFRKLSTLPLRYGLAGFQLPASGTPGDRTRREGHSPVEASAVAGAKKKARRQRRLLGFVDESGLSTRPTRVRTWALRGQTPLLQETFNWKSLSIIGGLVLLRFYFQIYAGSIK